MYCCTEDSIGLFGAMFISFYLFFSLNEDQEIFLSLMICFTFRVIFFVFCFCPATHCCYCFSAFLWMFRCVNDYFGSLKSSWRSGEPCLKAWCWFKSVLVAFSWVFQPYFVPFSAQNSCSYLEIFGYYMRIVRCIDAVVICLDGLRIDWSWMTFI